MKMRKIRYFIICTCFISLLSNCTLKNIINFRYFASIPKDEKIKSNKELFNNAYYFFKNKSYNKSCELFFNYINLKEQDHENNEWAQFFWGISLYKYGFTHASVEILSNLIKKNPNPKIVTYCLELFEEITSKHPFDENLIFEIIVSRSFSFTSGKLSDFINFHHGLFDWSQNHLKWGNDHFNKISKNSHYYNKYLFHKARFYIFNNQIDEAIPILKQSVYGLSDDSKLLLEIKKTIARLLYEKKQYQESDLWYSEINEKGLNRAQTLIEMAWNHYYLSNNKKALGLLIASQAPDYKGYVNPDYYILKALIYKKTCNYKMALNVVDEFNKKYCDAIQMIRNRENLEDNNEILRQLLRDNNIYNKWTFINLLKKEQKELIKIESNDLRKYLNKLYILKIKEKIKDFKNIVNNNYQKIANEFLDYEENIRLMEYEIGLDMYQRVYESHYLKDNEQNNASEKSYVVYTFQNEYWNDELADFHVNLIDKCKTMEEWDIFFK